MKVEGTLDGPMYVGKPDHLLYLMQLEYKAIYRTRLAASTWGCSMARAQEIYTKVVWSTIAYGASAYHTPADLGKKTPRGIAKG